MSFYKRQQFSKLIKKKRTNQNITQVELGEGIYKITLISRIEQGKFWPVRLVRDRLLERLGESSYDYEMYLELEDYEEWKVQIFLLYLLDRVELSKAEQWLKQYEEKYKEKCVVSKQFYLVMLLQWLELKGEKTKEYGSILEQAVKLTIPRIDTTPISELVLSISELNLVLEYITYYQETKFKETIREQYQELLEYIEKPHFDLESRALFCSKVSLYFCEYEWKQLQQRKEKAETIKIVQDLLEQCSYGMEYLRNHQKIYFAWELLQIKQEFLLFLLKNEKGFSFAEIEQYKKEQKETKEIFEVLDRLYETYHVSKQTNHYTIFYYKREVYCMNDVIKARRHMFQVSMKNLEDICSERTLIRLENKQGNNLQIEVAQRLFHKFHLSIEMQRAMIVTSNQEAIALEQKLRRAINQEEFEEAKKILQQLKQMIPMEEIINQQYIEYREVRLAYRTKKISKETFIKVATDILEYTIPLQSALKPLENKYFTKTELTILYNIAKALEGEEQKQYFSILQEYLEGLEKNVTIQPILGTYGLMMGQIASYLGNQEKYEESIAINKKIVEQSLLLRHLEYVEDNIYDIMWNEEKRKGLPEKENQERILCMQDCIVMDIYNKDKRSENWMKKELERVLKI